MELIKPYELLRTVEMIFKTFCTIDKVLQLINIHSHSLCRNTSQYKMNSLLNLIFFFDSFDGVIITFRNNKNSKILIATKSDKVMQMRVVLTFWL